LASYTGQVESAEIRARIDRQYLVVHAPGDLDAAGSPDMHLRLQGIDANTDVVLDMSQVARCSDEGWEMLSLAHRRLAAGGGSLTLSRPSAEVRATLRASPYGTELKVRRRDR
jgi:anti-anti-sigma factor